MEDKYALHCSSGELEAVIAAIAMATHGPLLHPKNGYEEKISDALGLVLDKIVALKCGPTYKVDSCIVLTWPHASPKADIHVLRNNR